MKIALGLEYRGANYLGWQRQKDGPTIQACVEDALSKVANTMIQVHSAGRTDTGVHALQQVIHFETGVDRKPRSWVLGGNVHLPVDISLIWARPVPDTFHARFSATGRTYHYLILNRPSRPGLYSGMMTWDHRSLDEQRMRDAAVCLLGEHDFTSFRALQCQAKSPVRTVRRLEIRRRGEFIMLEIEANAFLHHMVRNIAGVLMAIGAGKERVEWAGEVLKLQDRTRGGVTAPADGLYLAGVDYPAEYDLPVRHDSAWFQTR